MHLFSSKEPNREDVEREYKFMTSSDPQQSLHVVHELYTANTDGQSTISRNTDTQPNTHRTAVPRQQSYSHTSTIDHSRAVQAKQESHDHTPTNTQPHTRQQVTQQQHNTRRCHRARAVQSTVSPSQNVPCQSAVTQSNQRGAL